MTHITVIENRDSMTVGIHAVGHAGYAEAGRDIVCAAASVLIQTFAKICEALREQGALAEITLLPGESSVQASLISREQYEYASVCLQTVEVGLRMIAEVYPNHVQITADRFSCGTNLSEVI